MRPLLMIPGPIEVSEAVQTAYSGPPPSHVSAGLIEDFGASIEAMRTVWCADADSQPFVIAGSGTIAMDVAVYNVVEPGDAVLVVNTGYFSDRMAEMLTRRGAAVTQVTAEPGDAPDNGDVHRELANGDFKALFATHVDTSTGVRCDAATLAGLARRHGVLSVFDGVCATAGERFDMASWGADVYLTSSQKAIGLPAGLALMVASARAMRAREAMTVAPPMSLDWLQWQPIHRAYEERRGSYFSTPATTLIQALRVGLDEILRDGGIEGRFVRHQRSADAFRAAWAAMGLQLLPVRTDLAANTLSAIRYPSGVGSELVGAIKARGVIVAGGLHPVLKTTYFRVGHMGNILERPDDCVRVVSVVAEALESLGRPPCKDQAVAAFRAVLAD